MLAWRWIAFRAASPNPARPRMRRNSPPLKTPPPAPPYCRCRRIYCAMTASRCWSRPAPNILFRGLSVNWRAGCSNTACFYEVPITSSQSDRTPSAISPSGSPHTWANEGKREQTATPTPGACYADSRLYENHWCQVKRHICWCVFGRFERRDVADEP